MRPGQKLPAAPVPSQSDSEVFQGCRPDGTPFQNYFQTLMDLAALETFQAKRLKMDSDGKEVNGSTTAESAKVVSEKGNSPAASSRFQNSQGDTPKGAANHNAASPGNTPRSRNGVCTFCP